MKSIAGSMKVINIRSSDNYKSKNMIKLRSSDGVELEIEEGSCQAIKADSWAGLGQHWRQFRSDLARSIWANLGFGSN
ncbi:uncharacterized protein A4U43_C04F6580 [Asparagus officinalis]|uniref:Uncharacterized protein n=1 Tax=Asparagus officinalis TaxID=4686 RepID=A0A5P1F1G6_ASPOF|nr:uncharacterized protein A4U43_C04F6580 [Asparagus officinalis]